MEERNFEVAFNGQSWHCWYVTSRDLATKIVAKYMDYSEPFGLDTETAALPEYKHIAKAALSPHLSNIRLLQIANCRSSVVFDLHEINDFSIFIPFLSSKRFIAHNALFDLKFLLKAGVKKINLSCSYLLARILIHATRYDDAGVGLKLGELVEGLLQIPVLKECGNSDWSVPDLTYEQVEYSALDAVYVRLITEKMLPAADKKGLLPYWKFLNQVIYPVAEMELNGIGIDAAKHVEMYHKWRTDLYQTKKKLVAATGLPTITPQKIGDWLEHNLDAKTLHLWPRSDKTEKLSVDANVLSDFSYVPIVAPFAEYQKKMKLTTSFGHSMTEMINPATKRLHPSYWINGARSGRFSCSNPNIQQIVRDKEVRSLFIPAKGSVFIVADFSQIELRATAELSQDPVMLDAYRKGVDLHALTAANIAHKDIKDVTKEERQLAKAINFGLLYGLGARKFKSYAKKSYKVEVTQEEADKAVETFRELYSRFREFQMELADTGASSLRSITPLGKVRKLEAGNSFGSALNTPAQGGAAECMMAAMISTHRELKRRSLKTKIAFSVHDELGLESPKGEANEAKKLLEECMVKGFLYVFPGGCTRGLVEAHIGENWYAAK